MAQIKTEKANLKSKYNVYVEFSLIISLILLIAAFKFAPQSVKPKTIDKNSEDIIKVENVQNTLQDISRSKPTNENVKILQEEQEIFIRVEEPPEIVGGLKALQNKLYYTEAAKIAGIEGKVYVIALIDKKGNVLNVKLLKSLFEDLDKIAMKPVSQLKFKPGRQQGRAVKVLLSIPVKFQLYCPRRRAFFT